MPRNSPIGFVIAFFATVMGFALIWHIWWMALVGLIGILGAVLVHAWRVHGEVEISVATLMAASGGRGSGGVTTVDGPHAGAPRQAPNRSRSRERGPARTDVVVGFGFWLFLLSDIVIFASLFAAYAVLSEQTAGGPSGVELFDRGRVFIETACLLASSFTCGLFSIAIERRNRAGALLGRRSPFCSAPRSSRSKFREFSRMVASGAGPTRSAFLSAFFTLVGTHGLHVTFGPVVAARDDGADRNARLSHRWWFAGCTASACSGMRSISCGSACSRSSTWEPTMSEHGQARERAA